MKGANRFAENRLAEDEGREAALEAWKDAGKRERKLGLDSSCERLGDDWRSEWLAEEGEEEKLWAAEEDEEEEGGGGEAEEEEEDEEEDREAAEGAAAAEEPAEPPEEAEEEEEAAPGAAETEEGKLGNRPAFKKGKSSGGKGNSELFPEERDGKDGPADEGCRAFCPAK